jgi:hypothetical protein
MYIYLNVACLFIQILTFGSHPRCVLAVVISGFLCLGSSFVAGRTIHNGISYLVLHPIYKYLICIHKINLDLVISGFLFLGSSVVAGRTILIHKFIDMCIHLYTYLELWNLTWWFPSPYWRNPSQYIHQDCLCSQAGNNFRSLILSILLLDHPHIEKI